MEKQAEIHSIQMKNPIWGILYDQDHSLLVESRSSEHEQPEFYMIDLEDHSQLQKISINMEWLEKPVWMRKSKLYTFRFMKKDDPNSAHYFEYDLKDMSKNQIAEVPAERNKVVEPALYSVGSENHQLVKNFLSLDLELPCEYFEIADFIIISYYLRSGSGFDRVLLVLKNGQKWFKVTQDNDMKGFSDGAFFVVGHKLIFVRNRNEVCISSF